MSVAWIAQQIQAMKVEPPNLVRFNPRPPGVLQGGAAEQVLRVLQDNPTRYFTCEDLRKRTGRTHAAVSWALLYLRRNGWIEACTDSRNEKWNRYRITRKDQ